ncbi:MAG: FAD-dependent oxidoreductase [Planctomycetia bacterium]|nr:FAD-dependent oxidoreductase [Planctomycetia bacterium]
MLRNILWMFATLCATTLCAENVFVEAESFSQKGGWVVDQQFMDIDLAGEAGSSLLLAHGMGTPVADAVTNVTFPKAGKYHVFVRTRNWASPWMPKGLSPEVIERDWAPGKFTLAFNGVETGVTLGIFGDTWQWQKAGVLETKTDGENVSITLKDLTGFDGRLDAIYFTTSETCDLPNDPKPLAPIRRKFLNLPENPPTVGEFDLVVVGGGIAGTCAAVAAAKLGLSVALIQDRPVLGGNGSTEVRVHLNGGVKLPPYPNLGNLTHLMGPHGGGNAQPAELYKDQRRLKMCQAEKTLELFLSTHVYAVEKDGAKIVAVLGKNIETGVEQRFAGKWFADCTGDATVGFLAGADWHMGRESKAEFDEPSAPETPDKMTMGASIQWYTNETDRETVFPELPWAHQFSKESIRPMLRGDWDWETGFNKDQIWQFERIRDNALRAAYGHWAYMKNHTEGEWANRVKNREFGWMAFIAGKRESRRLMGDVVLREQDITSDRQWPDGCVPCTWSIDLHYPHPHNTKFFPGDEFRAAAVMGKKPPHYAIPYRTLYSRNVENLFMAGRNISVTHIALGTVRVMRTGGMMGEVVGMAASVCKKQNTTPRGVYEKYLPELIALMEKGVVESPVTKVIQTPQWAKDPSKNVARKATATASSQFNSLYPASQINDGVADLSSNGSRWVSDPSKDDNEAWVELQWKEPVTFHAVRMISGMAGNETPVSPIQNFQLQRQENGRWVDIPGAFAKDNTCCDFGVQFAPVTTDKVRIFFRTGAVKVRVWEVELY